MEQEIIPDVGGVWVLVEKDASSCAIEATRAPEQGNGGLLAFAAVVGLAVLHLAGGGA